VRSAPSNEIEIVSPLYPASGGNLTIPVIELQSSQLKWLNLIIYQLVKAKHKESITHILIFIFDPNKNLENFIFNIIL
jgi:hypothetical protein